jgi:hypothetical protein
MGRRDSRFIQNDYSKKDDINKIGEIYEKYSNPYINDFGEITGIPFVGEIDKQKILYYLQDSFKYIRDSSNNDSINEYLLDITYEIIKLDIDTNFLDDITGEIADKYKTITTSTFALGIGQVSLTVDAGLSWTVGVNCVIAYDVNNADIIDPINAVQFGCVIDVIIIEDSISLRRLLV